MSAEEAAGGQQLTAASLTKSNGGPDDNMAQANHLDKVVGVQPRLAHSLCARTQKGGDPTTDTYTPTAGGVRRLTPTECERLQGFPDGHTLLPSQYPAAENNPKPDSHRYAQMGNAVTVNVAKWLGERIVSCT